MHHDISIFCPVLESLTKLRSQHELWESLTRSLQPAPTMQLLTQPQRHSIFDKVFTYSTDIYIEHYIEVTFSKRSDSNCSA